MPDDDTLQASHRHCRRITRQHARSFYFSSFVLPTAKREAAYAIYAFCRHVDDTIDVACEQDTAAKAEALAALESDFDAMMAGDKVVIERLAFAPAFTRTVTSYGIPERLFRELIHGVGLDIGRVRVADDAELREYCYYVASVVGLVMARVFGLRDGDADGEACAIALGHAMQLTNILRDVAEDYARDRIYLPADRMKAHGLTENDLAAETACAALKRLVAELSMEARQLYTRAEHGIARLDDDGAQLAVWTMRHVYAGILDIIEARDWDVLSGRASTSGLQKLRLAWRARQSLLASRKKREV